MTNARKNAALLLFNTALFFAGYNALLAVFPLFVVFRGGSEKAVGFLVGLYSFSAVVFRVLLAKAADRRGHKWLLGIAVFTSLTSPAFYLFDFGLLYLAVVRIFHAVGLAAFFTASQTLLAEFSPRQSRGRLYGLYGAVSGLAMAGAPSIAQWIVTNLGWHAFFLSLGVLGVAMVPGQLLLDSPKWSEERESARSVSFLSVLMNPSVFSSSLGIAAASAVLGGLSSFLPLYTAHVGLTQFGVYFSAFSLAYTVSGFAAGAFSDRVGGRKVALWTLPLLSLGVLGLTQLKSYFLLASCGFCIGFGFGAANTALLVLLTHGAGEAERTRAVSVFNNCIDLGMAGGAMLFGGAAALSFKVLWLLLGAINAAGWALIMLFRPHVSPAAHLAEGK